MKTKCILPWTSLETSPNGGVKICCMSTKDLLPSKLDTSSLDDYYHSPLLKEIQQSMVNGEQHPNCENCWQEERAGRDSKRIRDNKTYKDFENIVEDQPMILDLKLGTTCNIKCRTCGFFNSSAWVKEDLHFAKDTEYSKEILKHQHQVDLAYHHQNKNFWRVIDKWLPKLKHIDMYGGEPMLVKEQWDIVKKSVDLGYSKDQSLHYNTNGTIFKDEYIDLLKNFKHVSIQFSIDGIADMFEYMRYPAKWNKVYNNMKKYKEYLISNKNIHLDVCLTISIYNMYYIDIISNFIFENLQLPVYLNLVHTPSYFNITNIPEKAKEKIANKLLKNYNTSSYFTGYHRLQGIIDFMLDTQCNQKIFDKFTSITKQHDNYRNQAFKNVFTEFSDIIYG